METRGIKGTSRSSRVRSFRCIISSNLLGWGGFIGFGGAHVGLAGWVGNSLVTSYFPKSLKFPLVWYERVSHDPQGRSRACDEPPPKPDSTYGMRHNQIARWV